MAKGRNTRKESKKKPQRTLKEKRQAKREKKNQNNEKIINQGSTVLNRGPDNLGETTGTNGVSRPGVTSCHIGVR
jgi:hypothetical protein